MVSGSIFLQGFIKGPLPNYSKTKFVRKYDYIIVFPQTDCYIIWHTIHFVPKAPHENQLL